MKSEEKRKLEECPRTICRIHDPNGKHAERAVQNLLVDTVGGVDAIYLQDLQLLVAVGARPARSLDGKNNLKTLGAEEHDKIFSKHARNLEIVSSSGNLSESEMNPRFLPN